MASFTDDMNEFDLLLEEDDAPVATAPSRTGRMPVVRGGSGDGERPKARKTRPQLRVSPDWNRIAAVLFVAVVVVLVLFFAVRGVMHAHRNGQYKDYFTKVRNISEDSTRQGAELETILDDPNGGDRPQRIAQLEQLAKRAQQTSEKAKALDAPEQLAAAQQWLETSLAYRARGIDGVQRALSSSIDSKDAEASADAVSAAMARLVASDVMWSDSFATASNTVLTADHVDGISVPTSVMVKDLDVVSPTATAKMLNRLKLSGTKTADGATPVPDDGKIRGGQLESGRVTVDPSGQTLSLDALTEIKGGENIVFEVPFTNQGEVQLTEVPVKVVLRGDDSDPVELTAVIDSVDPGATATAKVSLDQIPNFGEVLDMDILVGPIPGEKTTDNNRGSYQVQFSL